MPLFLEFIFMILLKMKAKYIMQKECFYLLPYSCMYFIYFLEQLNLIIPQLQINLKFLLYLPSLLHLHTSLLELLTDIRGTGAFIILFSLVFQLVSSIFIQDLMEVKEVLKK